MDVNQIIASLPNRSTGDRYGIATADRYFRSIETCFDGGFCPTKLFGKATQEQWQAALKDAESTLVYCDAEMLIEETRRKGPAGLTEGAVLDIDAIITTTRKDRDGDILESSGAKLDPNAPLLWQHIPLEPIGKLIAETRRSSKRVTARLAIIDSEMGRDAAQLVEFGALRISHGFHPLDFEPLEGKDGSSEGGGWHIREFEVMEISLVSVPSNVDAVITAFSRGKLHSPLIKGWAEKAYSERPVQVAVAEVFSHSMKVDDVEMNWSAPDRHSLQKMVDRTMSEKGEPGTPIMPSQPVQPVAPVPPGGGTLPPKPKATMVPADEYPGAAANVPTKDQVGRTGETDGHSHAVKLDDDGNGKTGTVDDHSHVVDEFKVLEADGHSHSLKQDDLEERAHAANGQKRGRTLSVKHEDSLRDAVEELESAIKVPDTPRANKALIRSAKSSVLDVLESVGAAQDDEGKSIEKQLADLVKADVDQATWLQTHLGGLIQDQEAEEIMRLLGVT